MALPAAMVITKRSSYPSGQKEEELELTVEAEANQYIPFALDEVNLDFQILGPAPNNPDEVESPDRRVAQGKVEDRVAIAEAAGLKPRVMDVESYATQEVFRLIAPSLPANGRDQNIALVDIGAHVTHFYVLRNNQFLFSRDQAFGGNQLTQDIQRAFNLSPRGSRVGQEATRGCRRTTTPMCCSRSWKPWRWKSPARCSSSSPRRRTTRSTRSCSPAAARCCPASTSWWPSGRGVATVIANPFANMAGLRSHPAAAAGAGRADAADRHGLSRCGASSNGRDPHQSAASPRAEAPGARSGSSSRWRLRWRSWDSPWSRWSTASSRAQIENQKAATSCSRTEIAKLDEQIKEIDRLRDQIQAAHCARKQVVETLQANRSEAVHLLDQLVRQLPDGIYLRSIKQTGPKVTLDRLRAIQRPGVDADAQHRGVAVADAARNWSKSSWCRCPVPKDGTTKINEFTLDFLIKRAAPPR